MTPLEYARKKAGFTSQMKLAKAAGVFQNQISRIERGRPAPREVAVKLLEHVGQYISLLDLLYPEGFVAPKSAKKRKAA